MVHEYMVRLRLPQHQFQTTPEGVRSHKEDIYVCTKPFGDGPYIGDFLVFNGTNN